MLGTFGFLLSLAQSYVLEREAVLSARWDAVTCACVGGFCACLLALYTLVPVFLNMASAAQLNVTLLMADIYSLLCGVFLFGDKAWA